MKPARLVTMDQAMLGDYAPSRMSDYSSSPLLDYSLASFAASIANDTALLTSRSVSPMMMTVQRNTANAYDSRPEERSTPSSQPTARKVELEATGTRRETVEDIYARTQGTSPPSMTDWSSVSGVSSILDASHSVERIEHEMLMMIPTTTTLTNTEHRFQLAQAVGTSSQQRSGFQRDLPPCSQPSVEDGLMSALKRGPRLEEIGGIAGKRVDQDGACKVPLHGNQACAVKANFNVISQQPGGSSGMTSVKSVSGMTTTFDHLKDSNATRESRQLIDNRDLIIATGVERVITSKDLTNSQRTGGSDATDSSTSRGDGSTSRTEHDKELEQDSNFDVLAPTMRSISTNSHPLESETVIHRHIAATKIERLHGTSVLDQDTRMSRDTVLGKGKADDNLKKESSESARLHDNTGSQPLPMTIKKSLQEYDFPVSKQHNGQPYDKGSWVEASHVTKRSSEVTQEKLEPEERSWHLEKTEGGGLPLPAEVGKAKVRRHLPNSTDVLPVMVKSRMEDELRMLSQQSAATVMEKSAIDSTFAAQSFSRSSWLSSISQDKSSQQLPIPNRSTRVLDEVRFASGSAVFDTGSTAKVSSVAN